MSRFAYLLAALIAIAATPAKTEVNECTVIASIPIVITDQGIYCLTSNLSSNAISGNLIEIQTNNVTIEMNGFKLGGLGAGDGTNAIGIFAQDRRNITVRNGVIRGFLSGITLLGGTANSSGHVIEDVLFDGNRSIGLGIEGTGNVIRNNRVVNTGNHATVINAVGIIVQNAGQNVVAGNAISGLAAPDVSAGIVLQFVESVEVRGNSVAGLVDATTKLGVAVFESDVITIAENLIVNPPGTPGNTGIGDFNTSTAGILCIDNVIANFTTAEDACDVDSGNIAFLP